MATATGDTSPHSGDSRPYPSEREVDIVLRDGSTAHVRPVRDEDAVAIREFLDGLSPESILFRSSAART